MNFYKHHIGDYAQATAHLSFVEDAAYSRMIRKYYAEEKPMPADPKAVMRLIGARTKEEKEAVGTVLSEFFVLEADGWHSKRCDAEITKANAQAETNRQIAEAREARKRARIEHESLHDKSTNRLPATIGEREPSQTPDTRLQTPEEEKRGALAPPATGTRLPADWTLPDTWAAEAKRVLAELSRPDISIPLEAAKFRDHFVPKPGKDGRKTDWLGTWRNWIRKACEYQKPPDRAASRLRTPDPSEYENLSL